MPKKLMFLCLHKKLNLNFQKLSHAKVKQCKFLCVNFKSLGKNFLISMCNAEVREKSQISQSEQVILTPYCRCSLSHEANRSNHVCFRGMHTLCLSCCKSDFHEQSCSKNRNEYAMMLHSS